jgi:hypothetical protein
MGRSSLSAVILGRLFKKGTVRETTDGFVVLVNEDLVSYSVDKVDVAVWN